jgi:hypothetical protein
MARIGLYIDKETTVKRWKYQQNSFEHYTGEILSHAGIQFVKLEQAEQIKMLKPDIVIAALAKEDHATASILWEYIEQGGHVISYAGLKRLAGKLGYVEGAAESQGYAYAPEPYHRDELLKYLESRPWRATAEFIKSENHGELYRWHRKGENIGPALQIFNVGMGSIERWSVNIPYTVVGFQQGPAPVVEDGNPAPDGSAPINDGTLKADDQYGMDWIHDRMQTENGTPYFAYPYADYWREVLISHLLQKVVGLGLTLPFIGYWPEGISSVAHISHDSDLNKDEHAETTLDLLKECNIHSTWCMLEPGYSSYIYERVEDEGHELAFHYNALDKDGGFWDKTEFSRQLKWLRTSLGRKYITSNKNHYTRFEGWSELFDWCESEEINVDQTRGPSKIGNNGFLFGTCHPYFPIAWEDQKNRFYNVLEIGFLTQDLNTAFSDESVIDPFLDRVQQVEGVAHFLFHQVHLYEKPKVAGAFRKLVKEAKIRGYVFWTSKQINDWERARRMIKISRVEDSGKVKVEKNGIGHRVVVWVPVSEEKVKHNETVMKFGVPCIKHII